MEEDIKILEDYIAFKRQFVLLNDETERYEAIENLIKGYRELEIENQSYRDYLGEPPCYDNASYIPKSKIKEKIEELKETADEDNQDDYIKIQVLKELEEAFEKHISNIE